MLNHAKVFWVAFGLSYAAIIFYAFTHIPRGAFPNAMWVVVFIALLGFWALLAGAAALAVLMVAQNLPQIAACTIDSLRSMRSWFRR